jgi:hypothetical protein
VAGVDAARETPAPSAPDPSALGRAEALRILERARHLYGSAGIVQSRRLPGGVESAYLLHDSLSLLLGLLVRLHGEPVPGDFAGLIERARAIAAEENLNAEDVVEDLITINDVRSRLAVLDAMGEGVALADDRRYHRAFLRSTAWYDAVSTYLDQRFPRPEPRTRHHVALAAGALMILGVGFLLGRHASVAPSPPAPAPAPETRGTSSGAASFRATFYRDPELKDVAFVREDDSIAFNWGSEAPLGLDSPDHFSVRWEGTLVITTPGTHTFHLTSDDGSRLFINDKLVVDNWGQHSLLTAEGAIELEAGTHPLKLEYFDAIGAAAVRLEWSSDGFARRLVTAADLR